MKGVSRMGMTKAFKRNILDDFTTGLSMDILDRYGIDIDDIDTLYNDEIALIEYTRTLMYMWENISLDAICPIEHFPKINCYKAFLKNYGVTY